MIISKFLTAAMIASVAFTSALPIPMMMVDEPTIYLEDETPSITIPEIEETVIDEMRERYPNGYTWDSTEYYKWNAKSNFTAGKGCAAFAFMLSDEYGNPGETVTKIVDTSTVRQNDIAVINNESHVVYVLDVDYTNNTIRVAEGNYMGVVRWDGIYKFSDISYILRRNS